LTLNRIAAEAAARSGVAFLDLHPVFAADWNAACRRFEFDSDAHWNEYGPPLPPVRLRRRCGASIEGGAAGDARSICGTMRAVRRSTGSAWALARVEAPGVRC
jgi:hypothetical protein